MPQTCSICKHQDRDQIDAALIEGGPSKELASRFGVSKSALHRHRQTHILDCLRKAKEAVEISKADNLINQVEALKRKVQQILEKAESDNDLRTALAGVKELSRLIGLVAKMTTELKNNQGGVVDADLLDPETARKMAEFYLGRDTKESL